MEFENIGDLVNQINTALGEFCNEFGRKRKELAGLGKVPKRGILFTYDKSKGNDWAINEGGGTEIQYHIAFDKNALEIRYGLGFNTQYVPFANEMSMVEYMRPFMNGYLKNEAIIRKSLPNYQFIYGNKEQLINPAHDQYTLFGKSLSVKKQGNKYFIDDTNFQSILSDLIHQFDAYQIIFMEKNNSKNVAVNITNSIEILKSKGQIILQGPPGTGKTYTAKDIAEQIISNKITENKKDQKKILEDSEQFQLIQFHPAFTYEDFVRGIVVKTDTSTTPEYVTVNKILGEFAKKAYESNLEGGTDDFDRAWYHLVQDVNDGNVNQIGSSQVEVDINSQGNIRFKSPVATYEKTYELYRLGKTDLKYETYNKIVLNF
jgi:hypothetical protein